MSFSVAPWPSRSTTWAVTFSTSNSGVAVAAMRISVFGYRARSAHVAEDAGARVGHLLHEVGHEVEGLVALVGQALHAQHVHLLAGVERVDLALDLVDPLVDLALGDLGR